jgi:hypothetical protein
MVRALLEKAGYRIYAFGYESLLSQLRYDVKNRKSLPSTDSNNRLRSTPDLLGYDEESRQTHFIEVKFSGGISSKKVRLPVKYLLWYQKYWRDAIIAAVIPCERIFYSQRVENLKLDDPRQYKTHNFDLEKDFLPIEELFKRVQASDIPSFTFVLRKFELMPSGADDSDLETDD